MYYVCLYLCIMYVCMYVCMYVLCMYVCMYVYCILDKTKYKNSHLETCWN